MNETLLRREFSRLLRDFQQVSDGSQNVPVSCSGVYELKADFIGFSGHFPGYPLLPAFIQIHLAQHLLEQALERPLRLSGIGVAKFTGQARPNDCLLVECRSLNDKGWDCQIRLLDKIAQSETGQIAKFRLCFAD